MEIRQYWTSLGRKRWALFLVPLIAGAAVFGLAGQRPAQYEAVASLSIPDTTGNPTPISVRQHVSDFRALTESASFARHAAHGTGVSAAAVSNDLSVAEVSDSSIVELTFRAASRAKAEAVVRNAGRVALTDYLDAPISQAKDFLSVAGAPLTLAESDLAAYTKKVGIEDPSGAMTTAQAVVLQLQLRRAQAIADGFAHTAAQLGTQLGVAEKQLTALRPQAARYDVLVKARDRASTVVENAQVELIQLQGRVKSTQSPSAVKLEGTSLVNQWSIVVQLVLGAMIVAFLVIAALLVAVEAATRGRRRPSQARDLTAA